MTDINHTAQVNKEALDALDNLLKHTTNDIHEINRLQNIIRQALLNGVDEVTVDDFQDLVSDVVGAASIRWYSEEMTADLINKKYPNGLKIIKDTKGD